MIWDRLAWLARQRWLESYCRRNKSIQHCFLRHSAAAGPQNMFLSDFDLTIFVDADNCHEAERLSASIGRDLRNVFIDDIDLFPATQAAYQLCASHYYKRSQYPMSGWRRLHGSVLPDEKSRTVSYEVPGPTPLDFYPETFLCKYLTPVLTGEKRPHFAQGALMKRKLRRDSLEITGEIPRGYPSELYAVIAEDVRLWDEFFRKLVFLPNREPVEVRRTRNQAQAGFVSRWAAADATRSELRGVDSVWVYPDFHNDRKPHIVLNLEPTVSREGCRAAVTELLKTFRGLDFDLQLGTRRSMIGRLNGLSRDTLLEPWLCKAFGNCLYGNPGTAEEIREPTALELKEKLRHLFLRLWCRFFTVGCYPWPLYRLCFTLDHLFRERELVLESEDLTAIYGADFLQESQFDGPHRKQALLDAWKDMHGLSLF